VVFDGVVEQRGRRIITERLVADAQREFTADMLSRPSALALLADLVAKVSADAGPRALPWHVTPSEEFELALRQLGPRDQNLAAVVKNHLTGGQTRADALAELTRFREELASSGRDEDEDVVLEVMDYVVGWASPHDKL
jgi:hypothetical protein